MGHYKNVSTIISQVDKHEPTALVELIETTDAEELADDLAYIIITLFAAFSYHERNRLKNLLLMEISDYEFKTLLEEEEESD